MSFDATQIASIAPLSIVIFAGLAVLLLEAFMGGKSPDSRRDAAPDGVRGGSRRYLMGFTLVACAVAFGFQYVDFTSVAPGKSHLVFSGALDMDRFAAIFGMLFITNAALVSLLAPDFIREHGFEFGEFYALVLFGTSGMMIMAAATDFLSLFVGIETMSLAVYVLTGSWRRAPKSSEGAMKYFIVGSFATALLLYGVALVYGATGSISITTIATAAGKVLAGGEHWKQSILVIGMLLILVALCFKIAAVPFHMWAPDAYDGAPTPVTAFMAAGVKAAGFAALLRVFDIAFGLKELAFGSAGWAQILGVVAVVTMSIGNLAAIRQDNIKRMLAYSSISHAGYLLLGVVASSAAAHNAAAVSAIVFYLVSYTFTTIGAFGVVAWVSAKNDERLQLDGWAGLASRHPGAALAMTVFMLSFAGLPPTGGFFGKFYLFRAVLENPDWSWLVIVGVVNSMVAAYYYLRVVTTMYFREVGREPNPITSTPMSFAIAIACLVTIGLGVLPGWVLDAVQSAPLGR